VAAILAECGVEDADILQAALLHDTIEDTKTTGDELEQEFGPVVRRIVEEVTEDKTLPKKERKARQVSMAPRISVEAKLVKIADKTANTRDMVWHPPESWDQERREAYLRWTAEVIAGCRGILPELEDLYDAAFAEGLRAVKRPRKGKSGES
jgi:guanosine-3',5'-bis(diphosphate) 3'-pyrophosphohydrolase